MNAKENHLLFPLAFGGLDNWKQGKLQALLQDAIIQGTRQVLREDLGKGDLSVAGLWIAKNHRIKARIITRQAGVLCGCHWVNAIFSQTDCETSVHWLKQDSQWIEANDTLALIEGKASALLSAERSALNFLQTLSGTATTVRKFVRHIQPYSARLLDTRKTIPGLRIAQKYATACGGGNNHRISLCDGILLKENHLSVCGGIIAAVTDSRRAWKCDQRNLSIPPPPIEVEVVCAKQVQEAVVCGVDMVLLDNFSLEDLPEALEIAKGKVLTEVSGNIDLTSILEVAKLNPDFISIGSLTKHVRALDLSLQFF